MMGSSVTSMRSRRVPTVPPLAITDAERVELQRRVRAHTTPQRTAKRAWIVLLAADGLPNRQIAPMVGMNQHTVAHWRHRFQAERLAGLQDRKRPGRPLVYAHDQTRAGPAGPPGARVRPPWHRDPAGRPGRPPRRDLHRDRPGPQYRGQL